MLRAMTREHKVTVLMITHKFREVMAFADEVTVLRRGALAGQGPVPDLSPARLAEMMVGTRDIPRPHGSKTAGSGTLTGPRLAIRDLVVENDSGRPAVNRLSLVPGRPDPFAVGFWQRHS